MRWRFLEDDFAILLLHHDLASLGIEVEGEHGIGGIINDKQGTLFCKSLHFEHDKRVGHRCVQQEAVVYVDAEAFAMEVAVHLDVVPSFVSHLPVGVVFEGVCQVEEQAGDEEYGDEEYGIENHEVFVRVMSFSAHNFDKFLQNYKKNGK